MTGKKIILLTIGAALLLVIILLGILFLGRDDTSRTSPDRWTDREILIPGAEYKVPDPESEILTPQFEYYIDPDQPFPSDIAEELQPDLPEALRKRYTDEVERELEEMLRGE